MFVGLLLAALIPCVLGERRSPWGQCGGSIGWSGPTGCDSGYVCVEIDSYYSQCLPGFLSPRSDISSSTPSKEVNYWFSFGDSYTSSGFLVNGTQPAIGNALGNPPYPGSTTVGGVNWVDVVTTVYNKSLLLTYNFAYGGATIDASLVAPYVPTVLSLTDQVNEFLNNYSSKPSTAPWTTDNTLFSIWIGINDIGNSYSRTGDRFAFNDVLLNAYFSLVQKLYNTGARNFLFINVPPVYRSPLMLAQPSSAQLLEKSVIEDYNQKLLGKISVLKETYSGVRTRVWDSYKVFDTILNDPSKYGFVDSVSYGATGDFWGNNYHPSSVAHEIFGKLIGRETLAGTIW